MTDATLPERVKQVLIGVLDLSLDSRHLADDMPLYSTVIGLDSLTLLHVITELEQEFSCQIDDEAVMIADLVDVASLVALVASQVGAGDNA